MKPLVFILIFNLFIACAATKPTPYQEEKKKEGYRDLSMDGIAVSSFKANANTKKSLARLYAQFRAIEKCRELSLHANIFAILDRTIEKEVTRSTGGGWGPTYGFGIYPYYGYSSFALGANFSTISSDSWQEVLKYPFIEVFYKCSERIMRPLVEWKELSSEQLKHLVMDVKGGIQIESLSDIPPNKKTFQTGDIVLRANGKRIERIFEVIKLFALEATTVKIQFLREGKRMFGMMTSQDVTDEAIVEEEKIIKDVCSKIKNRNKNHFRKIKVCY